jgi:hypothetical protein
MSVIQAGDVITVEGWYEHRPWWKFGQWFKKRQLKPFVITNSWPSDDDEFGATRPYQYKIDNRPSPLCTCTVPGGHCVCPPSQTRL